MTNKSHVMDIMLDIETLGIRNTSIISSFAAAEFDRNTGELGRVIIHNIDTLQYNVSKFTMDVSSVMFWLKQDKRAIENTFGTNTLVSPYRAFTDLNNFLSVNTNIWCHASFDFPIIQTAIQSLNIEPRFKYSRCRDLRTLVDLAEYDYRNHPRQGVHHTAIDDVLHQIDYAVACFKILKG